MALWSLAGNAKASERWPEVTIFPFNAAAGGSIPPDGGRTREDGGGHSCTLLNHNFDFLFHRSLLIVVRQNCIQTVGGGGEGRPLSALEGGKFAAVHCIDKWVVEEQCSVY